MASISALTPMPERNALEQRVSVQQIQARRTAIVQCMKNVMTPEIDYGITPGTNSKPTLKKPGAEKLCALFQLAPKINISDYSNEDYFSYQCRVELLSVSGVFCGEGVGMGSSNETKYKWRQVTGPKEFAATPEDRRRIAYKRDNKGEEYTIFQVRTEPADQQNTVLKMSKKRALIDAVLTATGASDIFAQDLEDLGMQGDEDEEEEPPDQPEGKPKPKSSLPAAPQAKPIPKTSAPPISEAQAKRFWAIAKKSGKSDEEIKHWVHTTFKIEHTRDLPRDRYDDACLWAAGVVPAHEDIPEPPEEEAPF